MRTEFGAWRATYTHGRWVVLSGPTSMVIMQPAPPAATNLVNRLWEKLLKAVSITEISAELAGAGLDSMPNLAVFFWDDEQLHCLLRGSVRVLAAESGEQLAIGSGAHTWYEVSLTARQVYVPLDDVDPRQLLQLPLVVGAVTASAVYLDAVEAEPRTATAEPAAAVSDEGVPQGLEEPNSSDEDAPASIGGFYGEIHTPDAAPPVAAPAVPLAAARAAMTDDEGDEEQPAAPDRAAAEEPGEDGRPSAVAAAASGEASAPPGGEGDSAAGSEVADGEDQAFEFVEPAALFQFDDAEPAEPDARVAGAGRQEDPTGGAPVAGPPAIPELVPGRPAFATGEPADRFAAGQPEPTQVLDNIPPYAPGQAPGSVALAVSFGQGASGTTGPWGAQGFVAGLPARPSGAGATGPQAPTSTMAAAPRPGPAFPASRPNPVAPPAQPVLQTSPPVPVLPPPAPGGGPGMGGPAPAGYSGLPGSQQAPQPGLGAGPQGRPGFGANLQPGYPAMPQGGYAGRPAPGFPPGAAGGPAGSSAAALPRPSTPNRLRDSATDHDGETVFTTGIALTHKPSGGRNTDSSLVLAATCPLGHANAPGSTRCRVCGGTVDSHNPQLVNRPVLATVVTSAGDSVPLNGPILVGRAPTNSGNDLNAELLRVPSPNHDISRTHVRIAPHEWVIEVSDLHSTNGTTLRPVDAPPVRLEPGQTMELAVGGSIDLGDGQLVTLHPAQ